MPRSTPAPTISRSPSRAAARRAMRDLDRPRSRSCAPRATRSRRSSELTTVDRARAAARPQRVGRADRARGRRRRSPTNPTPSGDGWLPDVPNWDALVVLQLAALRSHRRRARAQTSRREERVRAAELDDVAQSAARDRAAGVRRARRRARALPALQRAVDAAQREPRASRRAVHVRARHRRRALRRRGAAHRRADPARDRSVPAVARARSARARRRRRSSP